MNQSYRLLFLALALLVTAPKSHAVSSSTVSREHAARLTQMKPADLANLAYEVTLPGFDFAKIRHSKSSAQPFIDQPYSDTSFSWDGDKWEPYERSTFTYSNGNIATVKSESYDGSTWSNVSFTTFTYDGENRMIEWVIQLWEGGAWVNKFRYIQNYDVSGLLTWTRADEWSGSDWVWSSMVTNTYDGSNRLSTSTMQDYQGAQWVDVTRTLYTYSGSNVSTVTTQTKQGDDWVNAQLVSYTYDGSNRVTLTITQYWEPSGGTWENLSKVEDVYNGAGDNTISRSFNWFIAQWDSATVDTMKYNANHLLTQEITRTVQTNFQYKTDYTHNGSGNLIEEVSQINPGTGWEFNDRTVYSYIPLAVRADGDQLPSQFQLMQNHPNPFNPETTIRYSLAKRAQVTISVFNVLGQLVTTLEDGWQDVGVYETTWRGTDSNGRSVASGVYFYRLSADNIVETRKMVLMR